MPGGEGIILSSVEECSKHCRSTQHCSHFAYSLYDGRCSLQNFSAELVTEFNVVAGPAHCPFCSVVDYKFAPNLGVRGTWKSSAQECQTLCKDTAGCAFFSFWPAADGRCLLQGPDAIPSAEIGAISAPRDCNVPTVQAQWEVVAIWLLGVCCFLLTLYVIYKKWLDRVAEKTREVEMASSWNAVAFEESDTSVSTLPRLHLKLKPDQMLRFGSRVNPSTDAEYMQVNASAHP